MGGDERVRGDFGVRTVGDLEEGGLSGAEGGEGALTPSARVIMVVKEAKE